MASKNGKYEAGIVHEGIGGETKFRFDLDNRPVDRQHVERLKASMEAVGYLDAFPIAITPEGKVMDGQNRYIAATELGIPFFFIVTEIRDMGIIAPTGALTKRWTLSDYMHYFANREVADYVTLRDYLRDKSPVNLSVFVRLMGWTNKYDDFKAGKFEWPAVRNSGWVALEIVKVLRPLVPWAMHSSCISALREMVTLPGFDLDTFFQRLSYQRDRLYGCANAEGYLKMFLDIYNYRTREENRIAA